jgi:apolipoprotein N-acyltransferase
MSKSPRHRRGLSAWRLSRHHKLGFAFVFPAAWMLCEWLRATLFTGFAWNPIGAVWLAVPWVAQSARWIGTYGLSALVLLVSGLFWLGLQRRRLTTLGLTLALEYSSSYCLGEQ